MATTELLIAEWSRRDLHFVDFVVVGIFIGAIIVGAGAAVRDILPRRQPRLTRRDRKPVEPETIAKAWRRFCQSAGMLIITMGMIVILFTVLAIVFSLSDRTGWIIVGSSTALAVAVLGLGASIIPNHYRRGGFDPVYRTIERSAPAPVVTREVERRLGTPRLESADDLFADAELVENDVEVVGPLVTPPASRSIENQAESPESVKSPIDQSAEVEEAPADVRSVEIEQEDPVPPPRFAVRPVHVHEPAPLPTELPFAHVMRPIEEPGPPEQLERRQDPIARNPKPGQLPVAADPIPEAPLIDPDEELPAWNAPPARTPPPPQYVPPSAPEQKAARTAAGFESSLLADLDVPAESDEDVSGPFQSRLLNELTGEPAQPSDSAADVLLKEISVPSQNHPPGERNANDSR